MKIWGNDMLTKETIKKLVNLAQPHPAFKGVSYVYIEADPTSVKKAWKLGFRYPAGKPQIRNFYGESIEEAIKNAINFFVEYYEEREKESRKAVSALKGLFDNDMGE